MILYDFKSGLNESQSLERLQQAFGDIAPSRAIVFRWFQEFKRGRTSLKDEERAVRSATQRWLRETSLLWKKLFTKTIAWHPKKLRPPCRLDRQQYQRSFMNIFAWERCHPDGCNITWQKIKSVAVLNGAKKCWSDSMEATLDRSPTLSLVTKLGFSSLTRRLNVSRLSGSFQTTTLQPKWSVLEV